MTDQQTRLNLALEGRYRIEREVGEGGMATVYLAQDVRHERRVALKVLKPELAAVVGAERFLTEIKTTANLHHPHILPLHDSGQADSFLFYVMPYVEGDSLRDRLRREAQLSVPEAVELARKIAGALQHAHERGVIHRDIKPANILLQDAEPVVADFGIALAMSAAGGSRLTETGLSLGTPYYMSPEQATGDQEVGPASDVYAVGCVLYEMLVGDPPYVGNTAQAVLGKIIAGAPINPTAERGSIPPNVDAVIRKALEKLPADRFSNAEEFARALADPSFRHRGDPEPGDTRSVQRWRRRALAGWSVGAVALLFAGWLATQHSDDARVARFPMVLPDDEALFYTGPIDPPRFDLLADGSGLVYVSSSDVLASDPLYVSPNAPGGAAGELRFRPFDRLRSRTLPGTEGAASPAVSPDGTRVAFDTPLGGIGIASLAGGPGRIVVESGAGSGAAWGSDGRIYFMIEGKSTIRSVDADGGDSQPVVELDASLAPGGFGFLDLLPDERAVIATAFPEDRSEIAEYQVHVLDLETGRSTGTVAGVAGVYAESGHLLYVTGSGVLNATRLDARSLTLADESVAFADDVDVRGPGNTDVSVSGEGTLAYATASTDTPEGIVWAADGSVEPVDPSWDDLREYEGLALSPEGDRLVLTVQETGRGDLWIKELGGGPWSRLVPGGSGTFAPAWTPDGRSVTFVAADEPTVVKIRPADGSAPPRDLVDAGRPVAGMEWSSDGAWLVLSVTGPPSYDILAWRVDGDEAPRPLLDGAFDEHQPSLSADGDFLAYVSEEMGRSEVFVRPFPDIESGRRQISTSGGSEPVWDPDAPRLFFRGLDGGEVFSVDLSGGPGAANPELHLTLPPMNSYERNPRERLMELGPDGRFVMIERQGGSGVSGHPVIVRNFFRELRERVGR